MISIITVLLARGGGGGSSSGGGGGSFGGGGFYSGAGSAALYSGSSGSLDLWFTIFAVLVVVAFIILKYVKAKGIPTSSIPPGFTSSTDEAITPKQKEILDMAKASFMRFQKSWSEFDITSMKKITSDEYFKRMSLELGVLKNYQRQNKMENVAVQALGISDQTNYKDKFDVFFIASARDSLVDLKSNKEIFVDSSRFSEVWHFVKKGHVFVLDGISQTTEEASKYDAKIAEFSKQNNFYYDPDFGWLMMPSRGAIFGPQGFGTADINNHVIGYFKDKIVEFYSYEPKAGQGMKPLTVAQAILPKSYDDILVTEKSWYDFKPKQKGLEKIETESNDFNKKFSVWAARPDRATSFELLATNFMEKIYAQKYEINIEVVDNVLYLYSPSSDIDYGQMLEVLSWAFEEMKM